LSKSSQSIKILLLAAALIFPSAASGLPPGPARIRITITLSFKKIMRDGTVLRIYRIYNRPAYRKSIGMDYQLCLPVYINVLQCREYFELNRGQIIAIGLVKDLDFYRLAITGGIGYYDNVSGSIIRNKIGPNTYSIIMSLIAP
jgi:hypothetical protein